MKKKKKNKKNKKSTKWKVEQEKGRVLQVPGWVIEEGGSVQSVLDELGRQLSVREAAQLVFRLLEKNLGLLARIVIQKLLTEHGVQRATPACGGHEDELDK